MSGLEKILSAWDAREHCPPRRCWLADRHPAAHLLVTLGFVITATSFGKYELSALTPLLFYPLTVMLEAGVSARKLFWRMLPALPLIIGIGIFNPLLDRAPALTLAGVTVSGGWLSFGSILLRGALCVAASLLTVSVIGVGGVTSALAALRVPPLLVTQLTLTLRYLQTFMEEASRIVLAYRLRSAGRGSVALSDSGALTGQWLLRTLRHAGRVHQAMLCRGFQGTLPVTPRRFTVSDAVYVIAWCALFAMTRWINLPHALGGLLKIF